MPRCWQRLVCRVVPAALLCVAASAQHSGRDAEAVSVPPEGQGHRFAGYLFHQFCHLSTPLFYQILFEVPADVPAEVRSIAFRRSDAPLDYAPFTVEVEIGAGHSPRSPAIFGWDRPMNRGPDFEIVLARKSVSFPRTRYRPDHVYPFEYRFALDKPFVFQPGRNAVIELRVIRSTLCAGRDDTVGIEWEGGDRRAYGWRFGTSCSRDGPDAGNNLQVFRGISPGNPGTAWTIPPSATAAPNLTRYFGGLNGAHWGGLKLPYRLDRLGAPGCSLYISFDWEWPTFWDPLIPFAALDLPNDPNLTGRMVYVQAVRFDRSANALGMDTSNGWAVPVSPHVDATLSTLQGPKGPTSDSGERRLFGPVLQLSGR